MEDEHILALYFARDERAIGETSDKYGPFCFMIARNILTIREDAEECVNDTWHRAWTAIPPERPRVLKTWLGRVTRNLPLDRWRHDRAQKRGNGMETLLSELEECLPAPGGVEETMEARELSGAIEAWLDGLEEGDRRLFLRRYWYGQSLGDLAKETGETAGRLAQQMHRLRQGLRRHLEQADISI